MHVFLSARLLYKTWKTHVGLWLLWIAYHWLLFAQFEEHLDYWENYVAFFSVNMLLFYVHAGLLLPKISSSRALWGWLPVYSILEFAGYFLLFLCISLLFGDVRMSWDESAALFDLHNVRPFVRPFLQYFVFATLFYFLKKYYAGHVTSEGQSLKRQISIHFLVNFAQVLFRIFKVGTRQEGVEKVLWLQEYARFLLKKDERPQAIAEEVSALRQLLQMEGARKATFSFHFDVEEEALTFVLVPMVLLSLAENTLQHGLVQDPAFPATLSIGMSAGSLLIRSRNKLAQEPKGQGSGLGLKNLKARLEIHHHGKYELSHEVKEGFFELSLAVQG